MNKLVHIDPKSKLTITSIAWMLAGNILFAFALNMIIVPLNLYSGGFTGISQIIKYFIIRLFGIYSLAGMDLLGIIYFILNIPLFIIAYRVIGREFCLTSLISIAIQSLCLSFMPIPSTPILSDTLTACLIGGVIAGSGAGMVLRSGTSGGGQDIIGVAMAKTHPNASVGAIAIIVNCFIFAICFFLFDIQVVVYSLIYNVVLNLFVDRLFVQNINMQVLIFTKKTGISDVILNKLNRGATTWDGLGAYTNETSYILCTVVSKYEIGRLINAVHEIDPNAFIITNEGANIYGNYQKRLTTQQIKHPGGKTIEELAAIEAASRTADEKANEAK